MRTRRQTGQALLEYLVCCGALAVALLVPGPDGNSIASQLAKALQHYVSNALLLLSIA
jgi:hypothetical protein